MDKREFGELRCQHRVGAMFKRLFVRCLSAIVGLVPAVARARFLAPQAAAICFVALLVIPTTADAQDAAPPPAPPANDFAAPDNKPPAGTTGDPGVAECKGLVEKACRTNKICTWIIPTETDKSGAVRPPYCRKLGPTKKRLKKTDPEKATETSPATPPPDQPAPAPPAGSP
jgi:hypothetical protein